MTLPPNWKTTAAGLLSAAIGTIGPLTAYLATTGNPKATDICGVLTLLTAIARVWVGLLQNDAQVPAIGTVTTVATTTATKVEPGGVPVTTSTFRKEGTQ